MSGRIGGRIHSIERVQVERARTFRHRESCIGSSNTTGAAASEESDIARVKVTECEKDTQSHSLVHPENAVRW